MSPGNLSLVENLPLQKTQSASLIPVPDANSVFLSEDVWVGGWGHHIRPGTQEAFSSPSQHLCAKEVQEEEGS